MNCIWCGSKLPSKPLLSVTDHLGLARGTMKFYRCGSCGSDILDRREGDDSEEVYNRDYMFRPAGDEGTAKNILRRIEWTVFYRPAFIADIKRLKKTAGKKGKRLLDVGFGSGLRLKLFSENGFDAQGIENSSECVRYAREELGCRVKREEISEAEKTGKGFDIITAYAVLEHVKEPRKFLNSMVKLLKDGGILMIRVPVNDSLQLKIFKGAHSLYREAPRHVWIPSIKSLSVNMEEFGLRLVERKGEPVLWSAGQTGCTVMPKAAYISSRREGASGLVARIFGGVAAICLGLPIAMADAVFGKGAHTDFFYVKKDRS